MKLYVIKPSVMGNFHTNSCQTTEFPIIQGIFKKRKQHNGLHLALKDL
jgi:hypothetical protein